MTPSNQIRRKIYKQAFGRDINKVPLLAYKAAIEKLRQAQPFPKLFKG